MYRVISRHLTNLENLFELLNQSPSVKDSETATDLILNSGEIVFENVSFGYQSRDKKKSKNNSYSSRDSSSSFKRESSIESDNNNIPLLDAIDNSFQG